MVKIKINFDTHITVRINKHYFKMHRVYLTKKDLL